MIGRGTRTLDEKAIKPWCTYKDKFLVMDHWNNFERFGEKPEGEIPSIQDDIPVKIFHDCFLKKNCWRLLIFSMRFRYRKIL